MIVVDILILVWIHYIFDFWLQSRKVAENKSSNNIILLTHVLEYSIGLTAFAVYAMCGWQFVFINVVAHFITDWCTSRVTTWAWRTNNMKLFWNTIGFDQAVHITTLIVTFWFLPVG